MASDHIDFEVNQTKIKGGCKSGRKVVTKDSKSDLPLNYGKSVPKIRNNNYLSSFFRYFPPFPQSHVNSYHVNTNFWTLNYYNEIIENITSFISLDRYDKDRDVINGSRTVIIMFPIAFN